MRKKCLAWLLCAAVLLCSVPMRTEQGGLAEEVILQISEAPIETPALAVATEPTEELPTIETAAPTDTHCQEPSATPAPTIDSVAVVEIQTPIPTATPKPTATPFYYCDIVFHVHIDDCYSGDTLLCHLPEHQHTNMCLISPPPIPVATEETADSTPAPAATTAVIPEPPEIGCDATAQPDNTSAPEQSAIDTTTSNENYVCVILAHVHSEECYSEIQELKCTIPEHTHSETCLKTDKMTKLPTETVEVFSFATQSPVPDQTPYPTEVPATDSESLLSESPLTTETPIAETLSPSPEPVSPTSDPIFEETPLPSETPPEPQQPATIYYCADEQHEHEEKCLYPKPTIILADPAHIAKVDSIVVFAIQIEGGKAPYKLSVLATSPSSEQNSSETAIDTEGIFEATFTPKTEGLHALTFTLRDELGTLVMTEHTLSVEPVQSQTPTEDWTESFAALQFTGDLRKDVLAIAQTQLGYTESETDYIETEEGRKGYTRYGAWFGSPYEDWCAMFAAFCLRHANMNEAFPISGNVTEWMKLLDSSNLYRAAADYLPMKGDLVFFDWDADNTADHVGLISETVIHSDSVLLEFTTVEGNVGNQVAERSYHYPDDPVILGFGQIDANKEMQQILETEAQINTLPTIADVEEALASFSNEDEETAYLMQLKEQCQNVFVLYDALGATRQSYLSNADLLMDLESLWHAATLEEPVGGTSETPVSRSDDIPTVGTGSGIRFRLFDYDAAINSNGHQNVFGFRGVNKHDPEGDDTVINTTLDADGYGANRARVKTTLSNGYPVFDGRGKTNDFSLGYLFGAGGNGVTAYSPSNTPLQRNAATNLYRYDSARNAVDFDIASNRFIVRNYAERGDSTAGFGAGYADFMPFTYWNNSTRYTTASGTEYFYDSDKELDYWFGMTMDAEFFQPKNGRIGEENMIFRFSGDDDVWVFIDDVLVLDLGGTHGVVTGSINFATGEITQHLDWGGATTPSYPTTLRECFTKAGREPNGGWSNDGVTFADYSKHTFQFFYLERGAGSSNCKLSFNLPTLPDESLIVTKELLTDSLDQNAGDYLEDTVSYSFRVMKTDDNGNVSDQLFIQPGTSYTLLQNGVAIGDGTVQSDGTFTLKAGQSAQFDQMIRKGEGALEYVVQELLQDSLTGQYGSIEYEISGAGGEIQTAEGPTEAFTAYQTIPLAADESQIVTYQNKVAVRQLSKMKLTKETAPGSTFPKDQWFQLQVQLGDALLPVGSRYMIEASQEIRTVETAGMIALRAGETAVLLDGIVSGTEFRVTEPGSASGDFNAWFTGSISNVNDSLFLESSADEISGTFLLNSTVHVTVTNSSFDFSVPIPYSKQALGNHGKETFVFTAEQVVQEKNAWIPVSSLPAVELNVINDQVTEDKLTIGFKAGTEGKFYYKIAEERGNNEFHHDTTFYIVEITANGKQAEISGIWKNGDETLASTSILTFVNWKLVSLSVRKQITGLTEIPTSERFEFTLSVDGVNGFTFPDGENYTVVDESTLRFLLAHNEIITLPGIPFGASVTVSETSNSGYHVSYSTNTQSEVRIGSTIYLREMTDPVSICFYNNGGYQLPATGGNGTYEYTIGGLCTLSAAFLLYKKKRWKGGY